MNYKELITDFKNKGKGLMTLEQYLKCGELINIMSPCNLLVFGTGEDSTIWNEINKDGETVFLEDDKEWADKFREDVTVYDVEYHTKVEDYEKIGFDEEKLEMDLPKEVTNKEWDVVLVDAPLGHQPPRPYKGSGRMSSIYMGYKLLKKDGVGIIDDYGRHVEKSYSQHFFGKDNLMGIVENKLAFYKKV